jgi:hypothetical protein
MLDGRPAARGAVTREIGIPDSDHDSPVFLFQVCAARPDPEVTGTGPPPPGPGLRFLSDPAEVGGNLGIPGAAGLIPDFGPGRIGNQGTPRAAPISEKKTELGGNGNRVGASSWGVLLLLPMCTPASGPLERPSPHRDTEYGAGPASISPIRLGAAIKTAPFKRKLTPAPANWQYVHHTG